MISGRVNHEREPLIPLCVRGPYGDELTLEAIVDTGFDGWLSMPSSTISDLRLIWRGKGWATLADGGEVMFDTYEGAVHRDDQLRRIQIDSAETDPLVGMALLWNHNVFVEAVGNGRVTIEPR